MSPSALSGLNLNLLSALDALLQERSVTRAAARLGVTQSAMSHALKRLRLQLGDPLLVRGRGGLLPTPRAERLATSLCAGLQALRRALDDEGPFRPETAQRTFRLAANDFVGMLVLPPLVRLVGREAPGVNLDVVPIDIEDWARQLEGQGADLSFGVLVEPRPGVRQRRLLRERFVCVTRRDHPQIARLGGPLDLATYLRLPHVLISPTGDGPAAVDRALERLGQRRRVALRVRYFLVAPLAVEQSDLVLTMPRRVAESFARGFALQLHEPPLELPPFDVLLLWHERLDADPAHRWLREAVVRAVAPGGAP